MQSTSSVPRGALFIISGAAAAVVATYISYKHFYKATPQPTDSGLHRSNAVRRRRRRFREGSHTSDPGADPITRALEHLRQREESGQGYGTYSNTAYVTEELRTRRGSDFFALLPSRIDLIHEAIVTAHTLSDSSCEVLRVHIQGCFLQNFLTAEIPEGYLVGSDVLELQNGLAPQIEASAVAAVVRLFDDQETLSEIGDFILRAHEQDQELPLPQDPGQLAEALVAASGRRPQVEQDEEHTILNVLYRIAEEQANRNGYQHRGVECNSCGMSPIAGVRYHCANCWDYDLCETCESQQFHSKTHVFYKIRIPAPVRGQIKLVQPKWYPGNPNACAESVRDKLRNTLLEITDLERQDLDALYDQFRCIASQRLPEDEDEIGAAICRRDFDRYFTTTAADRPSVPNAIYDRIYAFYDEDRDGLISFREFAIGMADLAHNKTREARIQRLFKAFDADNNGFVDRRDFLHLLRANYDLNKELAHEMIHARDDPSLSDEEILTTIRANNPISAPFGGSNFPSHVSRHESGKNHGGTGDLVLDELTAEILGAEPRIRSNRADAIARQASETRSALRSRAMHGPRDDPVITSSLYHPYRIIAQHERPDFADLLDVSQNVLDSSMNDWINDQLGSADVIKALGQDIPLADIQDPIQRRLVLEAQQDRLWQQLEKVNNEDEQSALHQRWARRQFYLDEQEGLAAPIGYHESDSSDDESEPPQVGSTDKEGNNSPQPPSHRSRSSSKVRFELDDGAESKSDISSRNTPVNERWGGVEFPQPDRDVGVEIIYEAVQEAFNTMLDHFFREQEERALEAKRTRKVRRQHAWLFNKYRNKLAEEAKRREKILIEADLKRTEELLGAGKNPSDHPPDEITLIDQVDALDLPPVVMQEIDLTLPQNRPDEISEQTLSVWRMHYLTEQQSAERGGDGRLNILEFKRLLRTDQAHDIDIGAEDLEEEEHYWQAKADLGKFSWLSSWLEMASF